MNLEAQRLGAQPPADGTLIGDGRFVLFGASTWCPKAWDVARGAKESRWRPQEA